MEITANTSEPPLCALVILSASNRDSNVKWGKENVLNAKGITLRTSTSITRYLALSDKTGNWFGTNLLEESEVNHWISFSVGPLSCSNEFDDAVAYMDNILKPVSYFVNNQCTLADISIFSKLLTNEQWVNLLKDNKAPQNLVRWYNFIANIDFVKKALKGLPDDVKLVAKREIDVGRKEEGKFVDLPGAEMGKVVVRFPPEASGFLHIGHAKAALLNYYYKEAFNGKFIMRFDDTNPAKEKVDFEKVILDDVKLLQIDYDIFSHTSNYFDVMLGMCEKMIKSDKAYVDDTDPETMKLEREQKLASKNRENNVDKNMKMWTEMLNGTDYGQKCCVRAKIDMTSLNGCMRDPTIYRCKTEPHPKTGKKYKAYPTYDFACPIVDSIEGVTHCLRTMEYHDRDDQFYWFIDTLGLRKPVIWEYSRLNMVNTVLSKRKLTWFVDNNYVTGWDDPRMPTVRGILRRGMTVEGLKQFIIMQGSSRSVVVMEWDKIWAINKKIIDPIAPRYTAVDLNKHVTVHIEGVKEEALEVAKHPKNPDVGLKTVWIGPDVIVDEIDAELFKEGENVTFINWGNILIKKIIREDGKIKSVEAVPNLEDKNFKKTMKITWLAQTKKAIPIPCYCLYFDHLINKPVLGKDEDFKQFINENTLSVVKTYVDPELENLKHSEIIQLQRKGFFICDRIYHTWSRYTGCESPLALIAIPDGHTKEMPIANAPVKLIKAVTPIKEMSTPVQNDAKNVSLQISQQGDLVRKMKGEKADKAAIAIEVKKLLDLKNNYKASTGQDWTPELAKAISTPAPPKTEGGNAGEIHLKITEVGNNIRNLKASKADKEKIAAEVKVLLELKSQFKGVTGEDWKPEWKPSAEVNKNITGSDEADKLSDQITLVGNKIRDMKAQKADKTAIGAEVKVLLDLKTSFKNISGREWKPVDTKAAVDNVKPVAENVKPVAENTKPVTDNEKPVNVKSLSDNITEVGNKIRQLKSSKADKNIISEQVKVLLELKSNYKTMTGEEWKPTTESNITENSKITSSKDSEAISAQITTVGNKIRDMKASKAGKNDIAGEVKVLLELKKSYKEITNQEWSPQPQLDDSLAVKIKTQGDRVKALKKSNLMKDIIDVEVKKLISLKTEYKKTTGKDWSPEPVNKQEKVSPTSSSLPDNEISELTDKIKVQGDCVRQLKSNNASKEQINEAVQQLLGLKEKYKEITGTDFPVEGRQNKSSKKNNEKQNKQAKQIKPESKNDDSAVKKVTRLGLEAAKEDNLPEWYSQVLTKGEMIEYYDVSGCYVLRPWSFSIWENIKDWLDGEIKKLGVKNCYFPIFVSKKVLEKEKSHITDFAPEVAWVTKSGDSDLAESIAIRPTSETVMYPAYAKWIQSHRDLPIKLNQWNNVVRWEFKHPQPFLRTREFLWQEGHTAFASFKEAEEEVSTILDLYAKIYTDLLAVPVVKGRKTEKEKFAGGDYTLTVEAYISASGRAIQGATSHHLGQNFSKMFDIVYEDPETKEKKFVYQNSWGITTRTVGVLIMVHADNQGLVLPPNVASLQIVIVPCGITVSLSESEQANLLSTCENLKSILVNAGVRAEIDSRDNYSPGWKFNHWELKGVPIRVEMGPKDIQNSQIVAVRRDTGEKISIPIKNAVADLQALLTKIQANLFDKANKELHQHMVTCKDWKTFCQHLESKDIIQSPFCGEIECEDNIKNDSARADDEGDSNAPSMGAKSLCIPFKPLASLIPSDKCIHPKCTKKPKFYTLFGRSY